MRRWRIFCIITALCMFNFFSVCNVNAATRRVTSINVSNVSKKQLTMSVGSGYQLKVSIAPSNATNKKVSYKSSDSSIVSVNTSGKLVAKKTGNAKITVSAQDGSKKSCMITVKVVRKVSKISFSKSEIKMNQGNKIKLSYTVSPSNATNKKVTFRSHYTKVATVAQDGTVTAKNPGTATISVTSSDGSNVVARVKIKVSSGTVKAPMVSKIKVTENTQNLLVGETYSIQPTLQYKESLSSNTKYEETPLLYESQNSKIAVVNSKGVITAKAAGTTRIKVIANDGSKVTATVEIAVKTNNQVSLKKSQFFAHTGLSSVAPANTIPAFEKAATSNAFRGIESDVYETKDGKFVLYHDASLETRTNGKGTIRSLTLEQIRKYRITKGNNISKYTDLKVPTLEEYLSICKKYNMAPVLHIKSINDSSCLKLINQIKQAGLLDVAIITGSKAYMQKFRQVNKQIQLYWLCNMSYSGIDWAAANNIHINTDYTYVTQDLVIYAHKKGLKVGAWTVNNKATVQRLVNKGVDFITTDYNYVTN